MVIDTSALLAIFQGEPEADAFIRAMQGDPLRLFSAVSALEASLVVEARGARMPGPGWS